MRGRGTLVVICLAFGGAASCGPTASSTDGATVQQWRFEEDFRVGQSEEDFLAGYAALAFGPNGLLALLDVEAHELRLYSETGELRGRIAREGRGPGEFSDAFAMGWDNYDRLWVANAFDGRLNLFDATGTFIKTATRPIYGRNAKVSRLVLSEDGTFFWHERNGPDGAPSVVAVDTTGLVLDSTPRIPHTSFPPGARAVPMRRGTAFFDLAELNFLPRTRWAIDPSGARWSAGVGELQLTRTAPSGDTLLVIERVSTDVTLGPRWEDVIRRAERESGADPAWFSRPLLQTLALTSDGHVLVAVVDEPDLGSRRLQVYDARGSYVAEADLGHRLDPFARIEIHGDRMAIVTRADFDVPIVVVGRLIRS